MNNTSKPKDTQSKPDNDAAQPVHPSSSSEADDAMPSFMKDAAQKAKTKKSKKHRKWPWILLAIVIIIVSIGGYFAYRTYQSLHKVIQKNSGEAAQGLQSAPIAPEKLKGEGDGRVNVLLLGIGDPGHAGESLTDTIMVASYDPKTKDVAMLSLPRDLYVKVYGSMVKINTAYYYGEQNKVGSGSEVAKQTVSTVLGIPIHYFIRVDFSGLKQAVDSVNGVDITVPKTLVDSEYPCEKNESLNCGYSILSGPQHLNGSAALKYVRCRKGDCGDDFGRARRQQDVLVALRQKAGTLNFFTNPAKINDVLQIVGNNVRTDLQIGEIERFAQIAREVDPTKITNTVLDNSNNGLVKTAMVGDASVVVPSAGIGNYSQIQAYVRQLFVDGYIKSEAAQLAIENGTTVPTRGQATADLLKTYGYTINTVLPADTTAHKTSQIIDYTGGKKPYTLQYLQRRFGVTATTADPSSAPAPGVDMAIIVGANYKP
jgi:LCP family protein required for cell wall assembly